MSAINELMEKGVLISPEILEELKAGSLQLPNNLPEDLFMLDEDNRHLLIKTQPTASLNTTPSNPTQKNNAQSNPSSQPTKTPQSNTEENTTQLQTPVTEQTKNTTPNMGTVRVKFNYTKPAKKRKYDDFVQHFRNRYKQLSAMLRTRQELQGVMSISRLLAKKEENNAALIGMISDKTVTKNKNYILTLEDTTGEITVIVTQHQKDAHKLANDLVLDEVIGVTGSLKDGTFFANKICFPDVPMGKELKKQKEEEYMVVVGDTQVGSKEFLTDEFNTFIEWLKGNLGTPAQQAIAKKVKYAVFVGDLVEGVGIYPGQEEDLAIMDIKEQYEEFARYLRKFPSHIQIILCPGNHDAGRIAEPQPPLYKQYAGMLYDMPNVTMISSPGVVNIGSTEQFSGFDILLYHGYSIPFYSDYLPSARNNGGQKATDRIMKFLLQRRHVAPTHGCNLYVPDTEEDPLVIKSVPDFFFTGHIHRIALGQYRNVTLINASAWTDITEDQLKRGLEPQPGRLPIVNLRTREVKIMNFYQREQKTLD